MTVRPVHLVVMGVAGTGKTTIAKGIAKRFGLAFAEGDDFHSVVDKARMAAGDPLTDENRWPWLRSVRDWMSQQAAEGRSSVVACSALREVYRDILREADGDVFFIHLVLPEDVNIGRLDSRQGHFMHTRMLDSQLATLEVLADTEEGIEAVNVGEPRQVVAEVSAVVEGHFGDRLTD